MRVAFDTNVLLAGVFTRGVCERVLDDCWENAPAIVVVCSEHILGEFAEHAKSKFKVPAEEVSDAADKLRQRMDLVEPSEVAIDVCRDADDLPVLGTANAGNAEYLITGDRDLLVLGSFQGISIVSPREFFDLMHGSS